MSSQPPRHPPARRLSRGASVLAALLALLPLPLAPAWAQTTGTAQGTAGAAAAPPGSDQPRFFEELDDLPLMAGLQEMEEANVAFDKPAGRIGEVYAEGAVPADKVRAFYAETLPQFGWKKVSERRYERDGERLEIGVSEAKGVTTLRLSLSPLD